MSIFYDNELIVRGCTWRDESVNYIQQRKRSNEKKTLRTLGRVGCVTRKYILGWPGESLFWKIKNNV